MTKDDIQLLYEYDRWANNRVLDAASELSTEQFTRDLGGSFSSVRDTLLHIVAAEWIWLTYWKQPSHDASVMAELRKQREELFRSDLFPDFSFVKSKWMEIEKKQTDFVNGVTNQDLAKILPTRSAHLSLANLMQHLANHSTYHRGQIALMMRQLEAQPAPTDFHVFLTEGRGSQS
jgi:uncharacterized damage-inducible protein DinB